MSEKNTYRIDEVAKELEVSTKTVYRLIRDKELPALRIRDGLRVKSADLREFEQKIRTA